MNDLAEWLLARIAEDEAAARNAHVTTALPPVWHTGLFYGPSAPASVHIARWDPARVLAECEAKRRIVEEHVCYSRRCSTCGGADYPVEWPCPTLRLLALPYADHDGYREEWRP